jgi:NAD(P)-dependent dehydrogenase (short-subunit alcohol dehydrogenase family)
VQQEVLPGMIAAGQGASSISRASPRLGPAYLGAYAASKRMLGLTRVLAAETAPGHHGQCVCPGYVRTDMVERGIATMMADRHERAEASAAGGATQGRLISRTSRRGGRWLCCRPRVGHRPGHRDFGGEIMWERG